ncbi:chromosome partitioning protein [Actinophytocola sp.]|uniref:chromosome partitioning protein n=1 Tax=Actinophytocola sp. TaxID=1872138 RepID=UPI003D6A020D
MLIAVCSLKGSPGVTTWSVALAARWPQPARIALVECDPSGGSVATRFELASTPGLVSLAAAARRDATAELLWSHAQPLAGGLPVVAAPPGADYTRAALHALLDSRKKGVSVLRDAATVQGAVVIADCGRLDSTSPAMSIAREADQVLLLARPHADELTHLAAGLAMVDLWSMRPGLMLVGPGYPAAEVARELGMPVLARVPRDDKGARALSGHAGTRRGPARSALGKAAHQLATRLAMPPREPDASAMPLSVRERPVEHLVAGGADRWQTASPPRRQGNPNDSSLEGRS